MARLATMNSGESMFTLSPNDPYVSSVRKLAQQVMGAPSGHAHGPQPGLMKRLMSAMTAGKAPRKATA
jgi:pilus assembly protein CpaE